MPGREKAILLVEDNPDDMELTMLAMQQNHIINPIIIARDGVEALEFLLGTDENKQPHPLPALVLLDLKLPKIDGMEVLRQLRDNERTSLLPVVILTSSMEERDRLNGYRLRANSYICKPVDFNQFAQAVQQLHLYWLVLNELPPAVH